MFLFLFQTPNPDWAKTVFLAMGWILAVFLGLLGAVIIYKIFKGEIDLSRLICDPDGKPSLARFQNLIFTIVIAMGLFYIIGTTGNFPATIPNEIWVLLGISAGTFVAGKGLENGYLLNREELRLKHAEELERNSNFSSRQ